MVHRELRYRFNTQPSVAAKAHVTCMSFENGIQLKTANMHLYSTVLKIVGGHRSISDQTLHLTAQFI